MTEEERNKRRREFIEKNRHELAGLILDGITSNRTGADLALWCRQVMYRTDSKLGTLFDELLPPPTKPPAPLTDAQKAQLEADRRQPKK